MPKVTHHQEDFFAANLAEMAHLVIADPPYGRIVKKAWDQRSSDEILSTYVHLMRRLEACCVEGASCYLFGGIGKPGYRPFFTAIPLIEGSTRWRMKNLITWGKKRAYGKKDDYLFTREEIGWFVLGDEPRVFNIPYLEKKRGYAGYNDKYPAKSEYLRRTNVWSDITEILSGKRHECEKPQALYDVIISTSSNPGDTVLDPMFGSGASAISAYTNDRNWIGYEADKPTFDAALEYWRANHAPAIASAPRL